jgi:chemotaxis protein MotB
MEKLFFNCAKKGIATLLVSALMFSCVSQLKYNRVSEEVVSLRNERESLQKRAESLKVQLEKTSKELADFKDENEALKQDSAQSGAMYRRNRELLDDVFDKYDRLNKSYNTLLANSSSEQKETDQELLQKEKDMLKMTKDLDEMKAQIGKAQAELDQKKQEMDKLSQAVGQKDEKIREMQTQIASRDKLVSDFKARMDAAVRELNNSELLVSQKAGKVYVNIPNGSLFGTGETSLQESGKAALKKLAQVLAQNEEFEVCVEGHTDISPYRPPAAAAPAAKGKTAKGKGKAAPAKKPAMPKPSAIKDNWDLSAIRAASVARELYLLGIAGDRISATGKGEFYPLDNSASEEARRRNRRVEIVISPKLQGMMELISPGGGK